MEVTFSEYFPYEHHAAELPPLNAGKESTPHQVVIAGGGPTGLVLALSLAKHGIASVVLEADATVCTGSRAGAFTRRTMEIFDRIGVVDAVLDTSLRWKEGWTFLGMTEIARLHVPDDENQKFPPSISQLQNYIEHCLVKEAERHRDLIDIRWQTRLRSLTNSDDGVSLAVETADGDTYGMETAWLVACDGGQSTVRRELGLRMRGERHVGRYVIIDIRVDNENVRAGRHCWFNPPSLPDGTLLMYKQPRGMIRFDYQIREEDESWAAQPDEVLKRVQKHLDMLGIEGDWEPVWLSLYRASALTLDNYRHGRVLFCGDAAHLVPIFGVRGMNSAVEDAHNLAWKLAFTLRGLNDLWLLDTYSEERRFAALSNIRYASRGAEFMSPPSKPHRLMRDAVLSLAQSNPALRDLVIPRQHVATPLTASSLVIPDEHDECEAGPAPGFVLPECPVIIHTQHGKREGYLTDLLGARFDILYFSESGDVPVSVLHVCEVLMQTLPIKLHRVVRRTSEVADEYVEDRTGRLFPLFGAQSGTLYLVRPDGHVMARWKQADAKSLEAVMNKFVLSRYHAETVSA